MNEKLIRLSTEKVMKLSFEEILQLYEGLVVKLISRWKFKYEYDDLYQMDTLGLWDAYKFHDYKNGYTFGTLAQKTILNYINWHRQNNNPDKIKRETSAICDVCSYDSRDGYIDTFVDNDNVYSDIELKMIIEDLIIKLKNQNEFLRSHERKASERNITFLKLVANGVTQREIASMYGITVSSVERGLYKEYSRIKRFLRAETYEEMLRA